MENSMEVPQEMKNREFPDGLVVEDLVLSLLWIGPLLWHKFDSWPGNFTPQVQPKKKKERKRKKLTSVRMAIINKSTNNKCCQGCREKGTFLYCWWACKLVQPLWKPVWRYFRKLNIEPPYDPAIPLLGIYPDKTFKLSLKKIHARIWLLQHCSQ